MGSPSLEHSNRRFYEIGTSTVAKYAFLRLVGIGRGHCLFVKYVLLTVSILRGSPIIFFPEPLTRKFLKWARIFFGGSTSIGSWWFYTFCSTKTWRTQNFGRLICLWSWSAEVSLNESSKGSSANNRWILVLRGNVRRKGQAAVGNEPKCQCVPNAYNVQWVLLFFERRSRRWSVK
jgi:hypothetical protein